MRRASEWQALGAMTVVTLLWAGNFTAAKYATAEIHWLAIAAIRILATAAVFSLFVPRGTLGATSWTWAAALGLTGIVVNQLFFTWGIGLTTPSHSAIIHALIPVAVMAGSAFLGERPGPRAVAGMVLAVGGAAVLALLAPAAERRATLAGDGLTVIGMTSFAGYILLSRRVLARDGAFATVTRAFVASVPFAVPMLIVGAMRTNWAAVTWKAWSGLAFMIVGATLICYSLHMWSLSRLDALKVAVFTDAQPVLTTVIAQAFGVERLTTTLAVAAGVVILGVVLVQTSPRATVPRPEAARE